MTTTPDMERVAWQSYADACLEHDLRHARRAAAELRLLQLPRGRDRRRRARRSLH